MRRILPWLTQRRSRQCEKSDMPSIGKNCSTKKNFVRILLELGAIFCLSGGALAVTVEDEGLHKLSDAISLVVSNDKSFDSFKGNSCEIIGEKIDLTDTRAVTTYFLTTANACGWGAALGPIWLVRSSGRDNSIVLSAGGYSVSVMSVAKYGMRDIRIGGATAGHPVASVYGFNGSVYRKINDRK